MKLNDLISRDPDPKPWSEGDNIPWNDEAFSQRMLKEHLSQEHHAASRKFDRIDQHVSWIHDQVLDGKHSKILDLGCGPGLYSHRLAKLGHRCHGIDYSPASIDYAKRISEEEELDCTFIEADIRQANYGTGYQAAMQIYGEINVFRTIHAELILKKTYQALDPDGILIFEPHTFEAVQTLGERPPSWYSSEGGLNSPEPHLVLEENFWNPESKVTTIRYFVINASSKKVIQYAQSIQAYTQQEYTSILENCGYTGIRFYPSLIGEPDSQQMQLMVILAQKPG